MAEKTWRHEIRLRLEAAFHDRLRGILLYGSEARGEAGPESDLDLLVMLADPVRLGRDLDSVVRALYPLQLTLDRPIHALPVSAAACQAGDFALYRHAIREGHPL
jgi:predicted nucleotidyltransferase